jgi:hypothetical protein
MSLFSLATACCLSWLLVAIPVFVQQSMAIPPLMSPVIGLAGTLSAADSERLQRHGAAIETTMTAAAGRAAAVAAEAGEARAVGDASCDRSDIFDRLPDAQPLSG